MKVLFKWLCDFVELEKDIKAISESLTMVGLEVEEVVSTKEQYENIIVGKVRDVKRHPKADKLQVCNVFTGKETVKVVCGAPNVEVNKNVVLALPGAELQGKKIEKIDIKGIESCGMICSEKELGLASHSEGIIILEDDLMVGKNIYEEAYPDLDDILFDINVTPNRGDCLSHLGIARELSAIFNKPLKKVIEKIPKLLDTVKEIEIEIEDPLLCHRYTAKLIRSVKIKPSPDFIKARIGLCGMRPINNIVDITNYVMLGYGQPLHAFDYDLIKNKKIIVRKAKKNEKLITLDGKERVLDNSDLVIADLNDAIALAGVMGGENSEVNDKTKNILLESAYFDPVTIRKTAQRLNLVSEASYRFARGVDISTVPIACEVAALMMEDFAEGKAMCGVYDVYPNKQSERVIKFRPEKCKVYVGGNFDSDIMESRLIRLGFGVNKKRFEWDIKIPTHRSDVTLEEDIFEEIARLGFYQDITTSLPTIPMRSRDDLIDRRFKQVLISSLVDMGGYEVITYSFIRERDLERINFDLNRKERFVYIKNPLSEEPTLMRPTLLVSHLLVAEANHLRMNYDFTFFEIGKKYFSTSENGEKYIEKQVIGVIFSGSYRSKEWYGNEEKFDYFIVKGFIERFFDRNCKIKIDVKPINYESLKFFHPVESSEIVVGEKVVGYFGKLHPDVSKKWDLKRDIFFAELDLEYIRKLYVNAKIQYYSFSKFPWTDRDITVIVDDRISYREIIHLLLENSSSLVKNIKLIDFYKGENIGEGKKSLTFKLIYQAMDRTLNDEEVNEENARLAKILLEKLNVEFPK